MAEKSLSIAVTGASGFLGCALAEHLKKNGHFVHAFVNRYSPQLEKASISQHVVQWNALSLKEKLSELRITVVIHFAGLFRREHQSQEIAALIESNLTVGVELLEASRLAGIERFVSAGTSWELFAPNDLQPVNLYAVLKKSLRDTMSFYSNAYGLTTMSLKIFDTFGPGDTRSKFLNLLVQHAMSGKTLEASPGRQVLDLLFVTDLCRAFEHSATSDLFSKKEFFEYSLSTLRFFSLQQIAEIVEAEAGRKLTIMWGKRDYSLREVMQPHCAWPVLPGWEPKISLRDGIRAVIEDFRCNDRES